jgi:hypothetical protein
MRARKPAGETAVRWNRIAEAGIGELPRNQRFQGDNSPESLGGCCMLRAYRAAGS